MLFRQMQTRDYWEMLKDSLLNMLVCIVARDSGALTLSKIAKDVFFRYPGIMSLIES